MSLQELTDKNFQEVISTSDVPVVVDFWAEWCGPCRKISPMLESLAEEYGDKVKVVKVNVDEAVQTGFDQNILGLPTIAVFMGGERVAELVGSVPRSKIHEMLEGKI